MIETQNWLNEMAKKRKRLYAKYGKPLEKSHKGEFVAISFDGRTILGKDLDDVTLEAYDSFGTGSFVVARIGYESTAKWPSLHSE